MAEYNINIRDLLARAFGDRITNLYVVDEQELAATSPSYIVSDGLPWTPGDEHGEGVGMLGLPIFQQVRFIDPDTDEHYDMPDCLVSFDLASVITKTPVSNLDGTVIEGMRHDNWEIDIKVLLVGKNPYTPPLDELKAFHNWFVAKKKALRVEGKRFDTLGITRVVVEHRSLPQITGMINVQACTIKLVEDKELKIELTKTDV